MKNKLLSLMKEQSLNYIVIINISIKSYEELGKLKKEDMDLYNASFHSENIQVDSTISFFTDKILFSSFRQGNNTCTFFKPNDNYILAIFYQCNYGFIEALNFSDEINSKIKEIYN